MAPRETRTAGTDPYYLAAPVGWQTAMEVKRRFADGQPPIPVVGAASVDAAIARLEANPRCVAVLIHFAELPEAAIELMCRIKERWRRPVVCFHPAWHRDDVRRALQLGADSLLGWPFDPGEVLGDLEALHKGGISVTRKALLDRGGDGLLAPDPTLWVDTDVDWRARLVGLAERLRTPTSDAPIRATRIDPVARFTRAAGGALTPALAGATMTVLRVGEQHLPQVATEYGVDAERLKRTVDVGLDVPDDERREGVLAWLEELARSGGEEADAGVLAQLRRAAQVTLQAGGVSSGSVDVLANAISRAIGVPLAALAGLSSSVRSELASRVLGPDEADGALDQVRMLVLTSLIAELGGRSPTAYDLAALTALLGLRAGVEGIRPVELVRALARLDPPAALHGLDLRRLAPVSEAIPSPGNALDQLLRRAIEELLKAAAPMGYVDQTRLVALLRAARQGGSALVGPTTWRTVAEVISGRRRGTDARAAKINNRLDRLMAVGSTDARARLVRALAELLERTRSPMDAARFISWCRDAASGVIQTAPVIERVEGLEADALAGLERGAAPVDPAGDDDPRPVDGRTLSGGFRPSGPGAPTRTGPQVPDFGDSPRARTGPGGAPSERPAFDPSTMLDEAGGAGPGEPGGRRPWLQPEEIGPSPAPASASSAMPSWLEPGHATAGRRPSPDAGPSGPPPPAKVESVPPSAALDDIQSLAARGELDRAAIRAAQLADDEPGAADALNRAALALYVARRTAEAEPLWTRAAALAPDRPNVLFHLARLRFEQGRLGDAHGLVRQVLALRPHLTPAHALRARIESALPR